MKTSLYLFERQPVNQVLLEKETLSFNDSMVLHNFINVYTAKLFTCHRLEIFLYYIKHADLLLHISYQSLSISISCFSIFSSLCLCSPLNPLYIYLPF